MATIAQPRVSARIPLQAEMNVSSGARTTGSFEQAALGSQAPPTALHSVARELSEHPPGSARGAPCRSAGRAVP